MVPSNVIQRTHRLKFGNSIGTCFTIDIDGRQYVITAKHVVGGIKANDRVEIYWNSAWRQVAAKLVGMCPDVIDIAVFALDVQLSPSHPLPADDKGAYFGQDVFFLGFPFGLGADIGENNRHFPVPFIKKGALSSIVTEPSGARILYLDGNNNPGSLAGPWCSRLRPDLTTCELLGLFQDTGSIRNPYFLATNRRNWCLATTPALSSATRSLTLLT